MKDLTEKQRAVFEYMATYFWVNHQTPPMHMIAEEFGYESVNAAQTHINYLCEKGVLEYNENGKYKFCNLAETLPFLGDAFK